VTKASDIKAHYIILAYLLRQLVTSRYKAMAKDRVLFKFISSRVDPALLIDHNLQAEKESLDLAEMSLLKLVDSDKMSGETRKSAEKIQASFQGIFGKDISKEFHSESLIILREKWLNVRIHFYRKWLSLSEKAESPIDLAQRTFKTLKKFDENFEPLITTDKELSDEVVRLTESLHRFLMRKQFDYELKHSEILWNEFRVDAFKEKLSLP